MRKPRLSLCMIVRDEEKWITACLDSVRDAADEMIVVDTGSRDATPELAERCGAKVYAFAWNDDFAEARNFSLDRASGDWILLLDADERLDPAGRPAIRDILGSDLRLASLTVVNYYGGDPPDPARSNRLAQYRLFRNSPKLRFKGAIHEQLERVPELTPASVVRLPAVIHHYGYMDGPVREKTNPPATCASSASPCAVSPITILGWTIMRRASCTAWAGSMKRWPSSGAPSSASFSGVGCPRRCSTG